MNTHDGEARRFRVALDGSDDSFTVTPPESILTAARRAGYWLPYECGWGSCARCKATVVDGEVEVLFPEAPAITERDISRNRFLMCQSTPTSNVTVKPLGAMGPAAERPTKDYVGTLTSRREVGPSIVELTFTLNEPAVFLAGQYAILHIDEDLKRCYSMSNTPGSSEIEFIIKKYDGHPGSTRMFELGVGDTLPIELPYGDMYLRDVDRPVLLIAGGTGISAILSLARCIVDDETWANRDVHLLYGATSREELVCCEELEELSRGHRTQLHGALVQAPDDWAGYEGFVTTALTAVLNAEFAVEQDLLNAEVYLAGPPAMVNAVQESLGEHGIQLDRIHVDSFG